MRELPSLRNLVPLLQTSSAARGRRVLCDEHRVPLEGSLFAIVARLRRRQPLLIRSRACSTTTTNPRDSRYSASRGPSRCFCLNAERDRAAKTSSSFRIESPSCLPAFPPSAHPHPHRLHTTMFNSRPGTKMIFFGAPATNFATTGSARAAATAASSVISRSTVILERTRPFT
jgi:hypothetical protein